MLRFPPATPSTQPLELRCWGLGVHLPVTQSHIPGTIPDCLVSGEASGWGGGARSPRGSACGGFPPGLFPLPADQQEAVRGPALLLPARRPRPHGLQGPGGCAQGQLPPGGQPRHRLAAPPAHRPVRGDLHPAPSPSSPGDTGVRPSPSVAALWKECGVGQLWVPAPFLPPGRAPPHPWRAPRTPSPLTAAPLQRPRGRRGACTGRHLRPAV